MCWCSEPRIGSDAERSVVLRVELEEVSRELERAFVVLVRELSPRRDDAPWMPSLASAPAPVL